MDSTGPDLLLRNYAPRTVLRLPDTTPEHPKFPVIDAHNHLGTAFGPFSADWPVRPVAELIETMDESGVELVVDLDGQWGEVLEHELDRYVEPYPDRFLVFAGIDFANVAIDANFGETEARRLRESYAAGARGLKIWKPLGLHLRDTSGRLVPVDDARLDPLWETAGELDIPVLIHTADPVAFFEPLDRHNERWEQLAGHPDWHFYPTRPWGAVDDARFPSFDELMEQLANMVRAHPRTRYILAHVGCNAEDLPWVAHLLERCPNAFIDLSARIAELGRKPYSARDFFIAWQDRILFGTDAPADRAMYRRHYRFLETRDEYFSYDGNEIPRQGRWQIYGLHLPDDVLRKIYAENARRVLFGDSFVSPVGRA
jgi:predicted TIM-barrel fold metal-dependent hydrolase